MADVIWTPERRTIADRSPDYRLLACVETDEVVYVLLEGPALAGNRVAGDPAPLWNLKVTTALGDLAFLRGDVTWGDDSRSFFLTKFRRLGGAVDALTVTLERNDQSVMTARAVPLLAEATPQGQHDGMWVADPNTPSAGSEGYRLVICAESGDTLYALIEGPVSLPDQMPPDSGQRWNLTAGTAPNNLRVKVQCISISRRSRTLVDAAFEAPEPAVRKLRLILRRGDELLLDIHAVRVADTPRRSRGLPR